MTLVGSPAARLASMAASTRPTPSRRVRRRKVSSLVVSRLTFTPPCPAAIRPGSCSASRTPLVVRVTCSMPSMAVSPATSSGSPRRTSGSPPVSLIFFTPSPAKIRTSRRISS